VAHCQGISIQRVNSWFTGPSLQRGISNSKTERYCGDWIYIVMLNLFKSSVVGGTTLLLFSVNTILSCSIFFLFVFMKLIIPHAGIRHQFSRLLILIAIIWIDGNSFIFRITHKVKWDVRGVEHLISNRSYLVVSNHRSSADIFVLQHIFRHRIPFLKFFLKKELI